MVKLGKLTQKTLQDCEKLPWTHHTDVEVSSCQVVFSKRCHSNYYYQYCHYYHHNLIFFLSRLFFFLVLSQFQFFSCQNFSLWVFFHNLIFFSFCTQFNLFLFLLVFLNLSFWLLLNLSFFQFCHNLIFFVTM